jgi:hypothetical protein
MMAFKDRLGISQVDGAWVCLRARALCVLAVLAAFAVPLGFAPSALAAEPGQVAGAVTDAATQAGIEGLEVCARLRSERSGGHCARTGQNGEYTIPEIPAGSYIVEFSVPFEGGPGSSQSDLDYAPQYYDGKASQAEAEEVTVTAGETTLGVDAAIQPGGKITGVVTDAVTHDQVAGIEVCAYRPLEYEPSRCGATNTNGEYTIDPLVGGEYVVVFRAPSNGPLDYAPQYYSDQASAEQANKVPVTIGETTSGIDAAMQVGGSITGQVTVAATGDPLGGAEVCALSVGDETPQRCVQTNTNGEYTLLQLAPGQDVVEFYDQFGTGYVREYYGGKSSLAEADPLSVAPGVTITGVDASLHAVGEVTVKPPSPTETTLSTNLASPMPLIRTAPLVTLATSKLVVSKGAARVLIACSRADCQGSIELIVQAAAHGRESKTARSRKGNTAGGGVVTGKTAAHEGAVVLATGLFSLADGHSGSVLLYLTPAGRRRLAHARRHPLAARLVLSVKGGGTVSRAVGVGSG